jgi:NADP-dependent 3-hydroxy acid dehydrogenase YdfG
VAKLLSESGAKVLGLDLNEGEMSKYATFIPCDVSDPSKVAAAFAEIAKHTDVIDVLANNAGVGAIGAITDVKEEEWQKVFGVNVFGMGRVSAAAMPMLKKSKFASIVNTCSIAATAGLPQRAVYSAANQEKAAARDAAYYAANREKIAAYKAVYRAANREKIAAYFAANREKIVAQRAVYRAANQEKIAAYSAANREKAAARGAAYYAANREKVAAQSAAIYAANRGSVCAAQRTMRALVQLKKLSTAIKHTHENATRAA